MYFVENYNDCEAEMLNNVMEHMIYNHNCYSE